MDWRVVAAVIVVGALVVILRLLARRRVMEGHGRFIWLFFGPTLVVMATPIWVAVVLFPTQPLLAAFAAVVGIGQLSMLVWLLRRISRGVTSAASPGGRAEAILDPFAEYMAASMGFLMLAMLVAVVALLILAVGQGGS